MVCHICNREFLLKTCTYCMHLISCLFLVHWKRAWFAGRVRALGAGLSPEYFRMAFFSGLALAADPPPLS